MGRVDQRELKIVAILGISLAILSLTIAYAVMSEVLSIHGTAKMEAASWDIRFENLSASVVGNASYSLPTITNTVLTNYTVLLKAPGDSVTFLFQVVNHGNISARLSDIVKSIPQCSGISTTDAELVCQNLSYKIMKQDGEELTLNEILYPNSNLNVKLLIEYPREATQLPKESVMIDNLDIDLIFTQE